MAEFLHLDGYGAYVWPAYGLALIVMVYFAVSSISRYKTQKRELDAMGGGRGRRARANTAAPRAETEEETTP